MNKERAHQFICGLEIYDSLRQAITEAGGIAPTTKELEAMSAIDLLNWIAPNNIRFIFKK